MRRLTATLCLTLAVLLGSAFIPPPTPLAAQEISQLCEELLAMEIEINKSTPRDIDEFTVLISVGVNCSLSIVKYTKQITADGNLLALGWKERKQRQHTQLHCNQVGMASTQNWTSVDVLFDINWNYLVTFTTTPGDC